MGVHYRREIDLTGNNAPQTLSSGFWPAQARPQRDLPEYAPATSKRLYNTTWEPTFRLVTENPPR